MIRNFRLAISVRVAAIVAVSVAIAFLAVVKPMFFALVAAVIVLVGLIVNLIVYIEKTNKDLTHLLLSIRQGAFTETYTSGKRGREHELLSEALNDVVAEFARLNQEKELHYQFLKTLNENINVSILSFDETGNLISMNQAAKRLLDLPSFSKLEHFRRIDIGLYNIINGLEPDGRAVIKVLLREEMVQLSVQLKEIVINSKQVRIILLQNLNSELESKEIEAWHQLIRVLTHEIMNSVTPIVSLTAAVERILREETGGAKDFSKLSSDNVDDVLTSLATIHSRSKGLLKFVTSYKEFSRPLDARFEAIDISNIISRTIALMQPQFESVHIRLQVHNPTTSLIAKADASLLEQVLINLLKNAFEAVSHDGTGVVSVAAYRENQKTVIAVADNGTGIDAETLTRIFVPFFTTKPRGTGIGLSLSRQIMKLHNGTLKVQSAEKGSVFKMEW